MMWQADIRCECAPQSDKNSRPSSVVGSTQCRRTPAISVRNQLDALQHS